VNKEQREAIADWLMVLGGAGLLASLFLTWSHQFSAPFLVQFGSSDVLRGVPRDPTAWQVYSAADVVLSVLAVGVVAAALFGSRRVRFGALVAAGLGLGFTIHALSKPPTNAPNVFNPALSIPSYFPISATAGVGETIAIAALVVAIVGLIVSFTAD
jgi:hypothetical protein